MIIAHLSDLHVSRFGSRLAELVNGPLRAASGNGWEVMEDLDGWLIEARRAESQRIRFRDALRLCDDDGQVHALVKIKGESTEESVLDELRRLHQYRCATSQHNLAHRFPPMAEVLERLEEDPCNTNLRFCAVAHTLRQDDPDWIVVSGDLTDDGVGYELVEAGLRPFVDRGRVICIPGNHDIYPSPPVWTAKSLRKTESEKRRLWAAFVTRLGQPAVGSFVRNMGEGVLMVCIDSCHPPPLPASASGIVEQRDLDHLAGMLAAQDPEATRLACLHHHVINLPANGLGVAPFQPGMRLRNAKKVFDWLVDMHIQAVLNGHRHIGYRYQPSGGPLFVSAPSTTGGCRSGASPYYWRLNVDHMGVHRVDQVAIPSLHI